jgi:aspartate/methionine/tyrosine aminotransferase
LAKRYKFMVVNDFAYARITFDSYTAPSFLAVPVAMDMGVAFGSFSKSYNMAGGRVGYCVGNATIIERKETAICAWHWWKTKTASARVSSRCVGRSQSWRMNLR